MTAISAYPPECSGWMDYIGRLDEFEGIVKQVKSNPFLYPFDGDENLPPEKYRRAVFAKWYKALFWVDGNTVYIDAVCDCREDLSRVIQ